MELIDVPNRSSFMPDRIERLRAWYASITLWPFLRLLAVSTMFALIARYRFGWQLSDLRQVPLGLLAILEIALLLSLVSGALGAGFMWLWCGPLLLLLSANRWFYDASHWLARRVLRTSPEHALAMAGLLGELLLFGGAFILLRSVAVHLGVRL